MLPARQSRVRFLQFLYMLCLSYKTMWKKTMMVTVVSALQTQCIKWTSTLRPSPSQDSSNNLEGSGFLRLGHAQSGSPVDWPIK